MKELKPHRSGFWSISANIMALAAVCVGPFFGVLGLVVSGLLLLLEKKSGFVKYYAALGLVLWAGRTAVTVAVGVLRGFFAVGSSIFDNIFGFGLLNWGGSVALSLLRAGFFVGVLAYAAYGGFNAYKWKVWKPPFLGNLAEALAGKTESALYNGAGPVPTECQLNTQHHTKEPEKPALPESPPQDEEKQDEEEK